MRVDTTQFGLTETESQSRPFLASMGIYVFNYERLIQLLDEDKERFDFGGEVIPSAIKKLNVQAHLFKDYWEDIGTIRSFYQANLDLASPLPKFDFFNTEAPIYTRSRYLPPSKVHACDIDNSMISEGCILNGMYARNSIIGLRSRIDENTKIENSIVMGADFYESFDEITNSVNQSKPNLGIGGNSIVRRAIIDKNARIGRSVQLINKDNVETKDGENGCYFIREGIIIIPKNAVINDGTVV